MKKREMYQLLAKEIFSSSPRMFVIFNTDANFHKMWQESFSSDIIVLSMFIVYDSKKSLQKSFLFMIYIPIDFLVFTILNFVDKHML